MLVDDVAVSFDGDIAVSTDAMDRHGRLVSVIAWLAADGSHRSHATICALRHRFHCGRVIVGGWNRETGPLNRASIPQPAAPLRCCRPSGPLAPPSIGILLRSLASCPSCLAGYLQTLCRIHLPGSANLDPGVECGNRYCSRRSEHSRKDENKLRICHGFRSLVCELPCGEWPEIVPVRSREQEHAG